MRNDEVPEKAWQVLPGCEWLESPPVPAGEQECVLGIDRGDGLAHVDCTHGMWITKLAKCASFHVSRIYYCRLRGGKVLQVVGVMGVMPSKSLTIRKTLYTLPPKQEKEQKMEEDENTCEK